MTLIVSFSCSRFSVTVADRMVTVLGRPYDPRTNKLITCRFEDAFITIGYTGLAFVGDSSTDDWIARALVANPKRHLEQGYGQGSRTGLPRRLHSALQKLMHALREEVRTNAQLRSQTLEVGISGCVINREFLRPFQLTIRKEARSQALHVQKPISRHDFDATRFALWVSGGWGADSLELDQLKAELSAVVIDRDGATELVRGLLSHYLRSFARKTTLIGGEIISVVHEPWANRAEVRFEPTIVHRDHRAGGSHISYSPWILGPTNTLSPSVITHDLTLGCAGYEFRLMGPTVRSGSTFLMATQVRRSRPGR